MAQDAYPEYPLFKGLQKPLELMGLQGRYILWGGCTVLGAIVAFITAYILAGFVCALIVCTVILGAGAAVILLKQRRGLHTKNIYKGMHVYYRSKHLLRHEDFPRAQEAFPSLLDENGERKSFERFLNDVQKIDSTYNANYLRAEYNFVQASAEMAAKWEGFMEDGDRYNLQYRTQKDDKVRPEHAALHGVTLPPSDHFWEEFYPPNGWNCRCTVVQVRKSKYPATDHDKAMSLGDEALQRDKKRMFRFNPGIEQKAVPDYNPYTISKCKNCDIAKGKLNLIKSNIPNNQLCGACRWVRKCERINTIKKGAKIPPKEKDEILSMPFDEQFLTEYVGKRGAVNQHLLHCIGNEDHAFVLDVAKAFADNEGDCWINPEVRKGSPFRVNIFPQLPPEARCNPDIWATRYGYIDVKSPLSENNSAYNAIHASKEQFSCVCLTNHRMEITESQIIKRNKLIWENPLYTQDYVFWLIDGVLRKYKRP